MDFIGPLNINTYMRYCTTISMIFKFMAKLNISLINLELVGRILGYTEPQYIGVEGWKEDSLISLLNQSSHGDLAVNDCYV